MHLMHLRHTSFAVCLALALVVHGAWSAQATAEVKDETITLWVRQALREDLRLDPSRIQVNAHDGIVTLTGEVRTLAGKHYAALEAQKITGVRGVVDALQVVPSYLFDADVAQNVRRRLGNSASIAYATSSGLGVSVSDGVVTLNGTVHSYAEKQEATLLASEMRGVRAVTNHLTVQYPKKRSDAEIRHDVITTLGNDVYLAGRPIRVTVTDGMVTLEGTVGSAYQKQRAYTAARLIWNVHDVDNRLTVASGADRGARRQAPRLTEAQTEAAVRATFTADQRLLPEEIIVKAHEGDVTLLGTVPSYYQERIATQDARRVVGVVRVLDELSVRTVPRADAALQDDVQFQLDSDALLGPGTITVRVRNGIVSLSGVVHNNPEREHATEVASRVIGVRNVVNRITVSWGLDDVALQRSIERRLRTNAETNWVAKEIHVAVDQGKVTLRGRVNFWSERDAAAQVAFRTFGVRSVDNQLVVAVPEEDEK
jgi:osmotically-inducible protein OsmY